MGDGMLIPFGALDREYFPVAGFCTIQVAREGADVAQIAERIGEGAVVLGASWSDPLLAQKLCARIRSDMDRCDDRLPGSRVDGIRVGLSRSVAEKQGNSGLRPIRAMAQRERCPSPSPRQGVTGARRKRAKL